MVSLRLRERTNRWLFQRAIQGAAETAPMAAGSQPFAVLSMVHERDVLPYLLAVKTFVRHAGPQRIVLVADPSLRDETQALLKRHLPSLEILRAEQFRRPALPVGGTWERLAAIAALNSECSVVQLDADTLTFAPPSEVVQAASAGRSFVIRSEAGVEIVDLARAAQTGRELLARSQHIQAVAEARLAEIDAPANLRYVRGCSGFTGFGRGAISPDLLDSVSARMRALHGARWDEWGTEQVTSNLLAASSDGAFLLPHPRYCNADSLDVSTVLTHYIGYARFTSRHYERSALEAIRILR